MTNRTLVRVRAGVRVRAWIKIYIRVLRTWNDYHGLYVMFYVHQGPVARKVDNFIQRIVNFSIAVERH